jgi:hypothetical protein
MISPSDEYSALRSFINLPPTSCEKKKTGSFILKTRGEVSVTQYVGGADLITEFYYRYTIQFYAFE